MKRHQLQSGPVPGARGAFSLVEMMIALVILAFGLLIIGAALPIGLDYNRKSADLAVGEAVTDFAFEVIQTHVRNGRHWPGPDGVLNTPDDAYVGEMFRPWNRPGNPVSPNAWEPRIKVRPLVMSNIDASTRKDEVPEVRFCLGAMSPGESPEDIVAKWRDTFTLSAPPGWYAPGGIDEANLLVGSSVPSALRVYPSATPDKPFTVKDFFALPFANPNGRYGQRPMTWPGSASLANRGSETSEALGRLVSWTAFYRRATSYQPGADESVYEVIVVAVKRPTTEHRFARQDISVGSSAALFNQPTAVPWPSGGNLGPKGPDRLAATPWLVTFTKLPALPSFDTATGQRRIDPPLASPPATLEFECNREVGWLLPPGSIFVPARNDEMTAAYADGRVEAGFVPHAPQSLPIYEVVERIQPRRVSDPYVIKVRNNGFYPFASNSPTGVPSAPDQWPVWVIPPAVKSSGGNRQLFDRASPIIGVARRVMHFPAPRS